MRIIIFHRWYYKRCGEFFGKWRFRKSVKLLIQNYNHLSIIYENEQRHNQNLTRDNDELRKQLSDIRIKQIASDGQINWANKNLGANIRKDQEN